MQALQNNSMVQGLVIELIVPAVKTKDVEVRAAGLRCLGLACLLDKVGFGSSCLQLPTDENAACRKWR